MPDAMPAVPVARGPSAGARDHTGVEGFLAAAAALPAVPWLAPLRTAGAAALRAHGFPGSRDEDWKYTSARSILRGGFPLAPASVAVTPLALPEQGPVLCFVDGRFARGASRGLTASFGPFADARAAGEPLDAALGEVMGGELSGFDALNGALLADGAWLRVRGRIEEPLHVVHHHTGGSRVAPIRTVVVLQPGSHATVVEHFTGAGRYLTSAVTEVRVGANAHLEHLRLQDESPEAFHVGTVAVRLGRDAGYRGHVVTLGGRISRTDVRCVLEGPGSSVDLGGLCLLGGEQHGDVHTHVDHAAPHTTSRELFKTILDDTARGVFTGRVVVRPGVRQADSVQANHNLLLSERAVANTRPQLEIGNDDVKCAHGATVGQVDPEATFYLRQRGLGWRQARALLTWAFANEVVQRLTDPGLRGWMESRARGFVGGAP